MDNAQINARVAIADFNCDGYPDAATATYYYDDALHGSLMLRLGDGDGSFGEGSEIDLGGVTPLNVIAGDFNADGAPDLVVVVDAGLGGNVLGYLQGTCEAEPWSPSILSAPSPYGAEMTVADMNGDGIDDLLLAQYNWPIWVDVMLGGNEPLRQIRSSNDFSNPLDTGRVKALATGDFDGDGHRDVAAITGDALHLLLGDGSGTLTPAASLYNGRGFTAVAAADLQAAGSDQIIAMSPLESDETLTSSYRYDPASGTFAGQTLGVSPSAGQLAVADLDGDDRPDLVVAGHAWTDSPSTLLLSSGKRIELPSTEGTLQLADVTADGHDDLLYLAPYGLEVYPHLPACNTHPRVCGYSSTAAFGETRYSLGEPANKLLFGDVDANGTPDVITIGESRIGIMKNDGSGELTQGAVVDLHTTGVALADIESGTADEIVSVDGDAGWTVIRGDGSDYKMRPLFFPNVYDVAAGDFDGNGRDDLAFQAAHALVIIPNSNTLKGYLVNQDATLVDAVDFNSDGKTDLLLAPQNGSGTCVMYGPITQTSTCTSIASAPLHALDVADFNGDGLPDMMSRDFPMAVGLWSHSTTPAPRNLLAPDYGWLDARVMHRLNRPADLLVRAKGDALAVYAGDGSGALAPGGPIAVQQADRPLGIVTTHDLDHDGNDEIIGTTQGNAPHMWVLHKCTPPTSVVH